MGKLGGLTLAAVLGTSAWLAREVPVAIGARPAGSRAERVLRSPRFRNGAFRNSQPARSFPAGTGRKALRETVSGRHLRRPAGPIPLLTPPDPAESDQTSSRQDGLRVVWYGHSSALVEIEQRRVLIDPVWSQRCSPSSLVGPSRLHQPPVPVEQLPPLDVIVISHDHYDHLDAPTVRALNASQSAPFVVPLGVGAHLERWGVAPHRVIELDWHERAEFAGLSVTATPARHFSGRGLRRDTTLWASWVIAGESRKAFYSGDTGYTPEFGEIGQRYGPFDVTLIQVGAYGVGWPDIHLTPEDGLAVHLDVRGELMIPVHWGTFALAPHPWAEPVERLRRAAEERGVPLAVPRPGERIDVDLPPELTRWWDSL